MKMKFKFYFKYFLLWLLILPWINYKTFINIWSSNTQEANATTTYTVEKWDIKNSIEIVWDTSLVDEQSLQFNKAWTITQVNFKAWDSVKKWDTIAEIDSSEAQVSIEDAKINLENAKINLEQLYEWPEESNILQQKNSIANAENSLKMAKQELENLKISQQNDITKLNTSIETSKKELESSKASLELAKKELELLVKEIADSTEDTETKQNSTITNIEDDFRSYNIDIEKIIQECDYIMWVTKENQNKNDSYEMFLGAKDSGTKILAKNSLLESISMYDELKQEFDSYNYNWDKETIEELLNNYLDMFYQLYDTTDLIYKTVDNSVESSSVLTSSDISSMKSKIDSYRSSTLSKTSSIKSSIEDLNDLTDDELTAETNQNKIDSKEESIKSQELSIEKKEIDIANSIRNLQETIASQKLSLESKENDIESKEKNLELAKKNLEELYEWPTDENVRKAKNSIKQAELKLQSANENLDDYKLIAPFDWVIRKNEYMVWDKLSNDTNKYVYIENPNLVQITVMLDQIDIVKIKAEDKAIVTFDAYKETPVNAKISLIDTTPTQSSWVVYYEVKIVLDDSDFSEKILSGMTANVEIVTESREEVLLVKTSAIQDTNWKKSAILLKDWKQETVEIETWMSSWWMTEIISWLNLGDKIVEKEFKIETVDNSEWSSWLFNMPGWNRAAWATSGNRTFRQ